jgi:hypothetical protein
MSKLRAIKIFYYDEALSPDVALVGTWEVVQAERKFGHEAIVNGLYECDVFCAYLGAKRGGLVADGIAFDKWATNVAFIEEPEDDSSEDGGSGESQAPPAS